MAPDEIVYGTTRDFRLLDDGSGVIVEIETREGPLSFSDPVVEERVVDTISATLVDHIVDNVERVRARKAEIAAAAAAEAARIEAEAAAAEQARLDAEAAAAVAAKAAAEAAATPPAPATPAGEPAALTDEPVVDTPATPPVPPADTPVGGQ